MTYTPLRTHSQYTVLNATPSIKGLVSKAKEHGMKSLALTDFGYLYGVVDFYKACVGAGIKPIIGCELAVAPGSRLEKKRVPGQAAGYPILLLAKNEVGYKNLCKLSSSASVEGFYYVPRIDKELLKEHAEGLICLSGSLKGRIGDLIANEADPKEEIQFYKDLFGEDFYFEVQNHEMVDPSPLQGESWLYQQYLDDVAKQKKVNEAFIKLGQEMQIGVVATHDVYYLNPGDWKAHEILMNVQSGEPVEIWDRDHMGNARGKMLNPKRKVLASHAHYFKSPEEMIQVFPDQVKLTEEIVEKIQFEMDFSTQFYPVFHPPGEYSEEERVHAAERFLRKLCEEGINTRYTPERLAKVEEKYPGQDPNQVVKERLEMELGIITSKGMCDYLLIVYDFIAWAKGEGIPVGPGRGSGAGSIILYLIGITDIEPLRFNLFFERFINPERLSYPDIDVDICMERRSEVIDYTLRKYGQDKVAQIITFGTMKAKMAIKDVGRVLSVALAKVNAIAKLVPDELGITLDKALDMEPELRKMCDEDQDTRQIFEFARILEGSVRNTGVHAAGLIISGDPLTEHIPICTAKDSEIYTTQYSMKPVESVGMLKIDFLGLKTLTSIQKAVDGIQKAHGQSIDWVNLPLEDGPTFKLLNHGKTEGVFQLESAGMQDLAKQLHIDKFEEIIAVCALFRPGPMEMIPSFINRKHGKEKIELDHPLMEDIIEETYGIMVYQEQVMQIASRLAKYSLGEGDVLRRAMGKKDREEMARQREKFKTGSVESGIDEDLSMKIFDKIEKFASYGFNKSHAAAYGYLSYVTAYLKANYPMDWMAALMTCDIDDITKIAKHIRESQTLGIAVLPPDVNESADTFLATEKGVRFAMSGIKGVGHGVVEEIVRHQPFDSFEDFFAKVDLKKVGKKAIETLIEAGAFASFGWKRRAMLASVEPMYDAGVRKQKEKAHGVMDLFAEMDEELTFKPPVAEEMTKQEILAKEKELLGVYLTGHPMDDYADLVKRLSCVPFKDLPDMAEGSVCRMAFIIDSVKVRITSKSQRKFAILTISDGVQRYELPVWPGLFDDHQALMEESQLIYAVIAIEKEYGEVKLQCRWLGNLAQASDALVAECDKAFEVAKSDVAREKTMKKERKPKGPMPHVKVTMDVNATPLSGILELKEVLETFGGTAPLELSFQSGEKRMGRVVIKDSWGVEANDELLENLRKFPFVHSAAIDMIDA